jgi:hypothetical protein
VHRSTRHLRREKEAYAPGRSREVTPMRAALRVREPGCAGTTSRIPHVEGLVVVVQAAAYSGVKILRSENVGKAFVTCILRQVA